jgi:membrane associated rhomboid family serine protease
LIIPWRVDVPQDRWPFSNWLIIAGTIAAFVFQTISTRERAARLPDKLKEFENRSVEDVAKELGVPEQRLKEIEQSVEKTIGKVKNELSLKNMPPHFKEETIKRIMLQEYFVWGQVRPFILNGWKIRGLFGYMWLHGGILHLLGNMLFLWIFGNAVCAKIGNFRYLPIYLGLGLISGITQLVFGGGRAIGASGVINGIVGMYLVFFPENEITCYFVFFFPLLVRPYVKEFCLSGIWVILFWLVFDIWGAMKGSGQVAYFAHIGGFAGGFVLALLMLKLKIVTMERYEKSLLQVLAGYKKPAEDELKPYHSGYLGIVQRDLLDQPEPIATNPPEARTISLEPKTIPLEHEASKEEFIRFVCTCGKKLKVPIKYAGKTGRCPKCKIRVRVPDK